MAEYVELYMDQGTDFSTTIALNDDNTNEPQNVAGYIITAQMRKSLLSANAYASFECSITDTWLGEIAIEMSAANTANIPFGRYFFDVRVTDSNSITSRLIEGLIFVSPGITR